jgi:NAD+ synthase (glutamine-hydrolysing)
VQTLDLAHQGDAQKIALKIFPELGTFENVQAGLRTDYLFRLANHNRALVCGTGDLSELGLGWCTYGVGDHMSHYNVNASVSKTLIQHLIRFVATSGEVDEATAKTLLTILATEISPELVPPDASGLIQSTEKMIGPYELQDFNLYYVTRYGFRPSKIAYLAHHAWSDASRGSWPENIGADERRTYSLTEIKRWLEVFLAISQFKRSALPNGPIRPAACCRTGVLPRTGMHGCGSTNYTRMCRRIFFG